jgi:hypothetical protein
MVKKYRYKYIVIVGNEVVGVYDDEITAIKESRKKYKPGHFMVQYVDKGKDNYTISYVSPIFNYAT